MNDRPRIEKLRRDHHVDLFDCGQEALNRFLVQAADIAGIRAIAVHAKDDDARAFYERFGFVAAPADPYHLFVLLQACAFSFGLLQDRNVWVSVFPEGEEIRVDGG